MSEFSANQMLTEEERLKLKASQHERDAAEILVIGMNISSDQANKLVAHLREAALYRTAAAITGFRYTGMGG